MRIQIDYDLILGYERVIAEQQAKIEALQKQIAECDQYKARVWAADRRVIREVIEAESNVEGV